jgi:HAD superfamily hydrolase (TIGR01490 family)
MKAAIFDIDHTLISGSTGSMFLLRSIRTGIIPLSRALHIPSSTLRYRYGNFSMDLLFERMLPIKGIPFKKIEATADESYRKRVIQRVFPQALEKVAQERKKGRLIVLATSSLDFIIRPVVEAFLPDKVVASRLDVDDQGVCTGRIAGNPAFGEHKLQKVSALLDKLAIPLKECSFYSDSIYDLPLLEAVGEPVVVNPDRQLRKIAGKRLWHMHHFRL